MGLQKDFVDFVLGFFLGIVKFEPLNDVAQWTENSRPNGPPLPSKRRTFQPQGPHCNRKAPLARYNSWSFHCICKATYLNRKNPNTITTSLEKRQQNLKRASESPTMMEPLKAGRGNPAEWCWRYLKWKSKWKPTWKPKWKPMWKTMWISSEFPVNFFGVFSSVFCVQTSEEKIH